MRDWFVRYGEFRQVNGDEVSRCFHICSEYGVGYWQYWYFWVPDAAPDRWLDAIIYTVEEDSQFTEFLDDCSDDDVLWACDDSAVHVTVGEIRAMVDHRDE